MKSFDIVVIGAGASGLTAALYLKRANVNVAIIERNAPGGQLNMICEINNYPGFKSISGPDLAFNMFTQVRELNVPYIYGNVKEIINEDDKKIIKLNDEEISCKGIIIATGRRPRELGLDNEKKLIGNGISYCSICDGSLYKDKDVCVVGGGNSAIESVLYLSDIAKKVYLIHRSELRAEEITIDMVKEKTNVEFVMPDKIVKINSSDGKVVGVELESKRNIELSGIFVNVGYVPIPIKCDGLLTNNNYIVVDKSMKTNIDKIYACGDIIDKDVYQISTAVGDATTAAMNLLKEI